MTRIGIVTSSTRPTRIGHHVAQWVASQAPDGVEVEPIDLRDLALPLLDEPEMPSSGQYAHEHTKRWAALVDGVDAVVFVMPEYNRGYNAALKNAIDYLYAQWQGKPVACVGSAPAGRFYLPQRGRSGRTKPHQQPGGVAALVRDRRGFVARAIIPAEPHP